MKKVICTIFAIMLTFLSSCSTIPAETTPIATTLIMTTPADKGSDPYYLGDQNLPPLGNSPYSGELLAEWGVYPVFYLGTHNGYAVYEIKTSLRGIGKKFIGGVPFWWGEVQAVACKDGAVYSLSLAYEEGILTYEDLRAIAWYWYGDVFPKDDYIPVYSNGYYSTDEIGIIGGVAFWIGQYHTFYVVKDGEWCKLDQAVNDGCLTYENLRTIAYYMYGESFPGDEPFDKSIS